MNHFVPAYFAHPTNPITIHLVGVGGTGSLMLTRLVQINLSLLALGMKGISVCAWDPDKFSEANFGRQNVAPSDVGRYKAETLISRINRTYGFAWKFQNSMFNGASSSNILITCIDSGAGRKKIHEQWRFHTNEMLRREHVVKSDISPTTKLYWLDMGNARHSGQVILGTHTRIKQPGRKGKHVDFLPHVMDVYPDLDKYDQPDEPSCSHAESLRKQSLLINGHMAQWGAQILTDMLLSYKLDYQGVYVNLKTYCTNPIPIRVPEPYLPVPDKKGRIPSAKEVRQAAALIHARNEDY